MDNSEIIELLTRLREVEPDNQGIVNRCDAAIAELKWTEPSPSPNAKAWNTTVAGRSFGEMNVEPGPWNFVTAEEFEIYKRACADAYGNVVFVR